MSIHNPFSMTFGGDPVVGMVPAQLIVYGNLSDAQLGMVRARYAQFCTTMRLSIAPSLTMQYVLPDGSQMRAASIFGVNSVQVWPVGGEEPYVGIRGIGVTYVDSEGVITKYILTPGGTYNTPNGEWKSKEVKNINGGDVVWQSSANELNYSVSKKSTGSAYRLNGIILKPVNYSSAVTGIFSHADSESKYIAAAYGSSSMSIEVRRSPALNVIYPENSSTTSAPPFSGAVHVFTGWQPVAASHDGSKVLAKKSSDDAPNHITEAAWFSLNGVAEPEDVAISIPAINESESPDSAISDFQAANITNPLSGESWAYDRSFSWDAVSDSTSPRGVLLSGVGVSHADSAIQRKRTVIHSRSGNGTASSYGNIYASDGQAWSGSQDDRNEFSDSIEIDLGWCKFYEIEASATQLYSESVSGTAMASGPTEEYSPMHGSGAANSSMNGVIEYRELAFFSEEKNVLIFLELKQSCSISLHRGMEASSDFYGYFHYSDTFSGSPEQSGNIVVQVGLERILEIPVGGDVSFVRSESSDGEERVFTYRFHEFHEQTPGVYQLSPGFANMFAIYTYGDLPIFEVRSAKDPLTNALIVHLNVVNTRIDNGTFSKWFVFDDGEVKSIHDISPIPDSVIPTAIESV